MPLRWQEAAVPLVAILTLVLLKHVPAMAEFPLARIAGVIAFSYAIFLALRLIQSEHAVTSDGWHELRASPVELFGAFGSGVFSALLLSAVLLNGPIENIAFQHMAMAMALSLVFALAAGAIAVTTILVKTRWNRSLIERRSAFGAVTKIRWAEVTSVEPTWRGVTIRAGSTRLITFSPYHSGAAELAKFASDRARRNATSAARAFASS